MSFRQNVAVVAAMTLCVASLVGLSTPGFASEMSRTPISTPSMATLLPINGDTATKVPATPTPEIPGVTVQRLPGDAAPDAGDLGVGRVFQQILTAARVGVLEKLGGDNGNRRAHVLELGANSGAGQRVLSPVAVTAIGRFNDEWRQDDRIFVRVCFVIWGHGLAE